MSRTAPTEIPVCNANHKIIDWVDPARARRLSLASNATTVRKRVRGSLRKLGHGTEIVRIILGSAGDDSLKNGFHGDPRKYTYLDRSAEIPQGVHTLRHLPNSTESLYRLSVTDCLAA